MLGSLDFYLANGERKVININGGSVTIRRDDQKPYQAVRIAEENRMPLLIELDALLRKYATE